MKTRPQKVMHPHSSLQTVTLGNAALCAGNEKLEVLVRAGEAVFIFYIPPSGQEGSLDFNPGKIAVAVGSMRKLASVQTAFNMIKNEGYEIYLEVCTAHIQEQDSLKSKMVAFCKQQKEKIWNGKDKSESIDAAFTPLEIESKATYDVLFKLKNNHAKAFTLSIESKLTTTQTERVNPHNENYSFGKLLSKFTFTTMTPTKSRQPEISQPLITKTIH